MPFDCKFLIETGGIFGHAWMKMFSIEQTFSRYNKNKYLSEIAQNLQLWQENIWFNTQCLGWFSVLAKCYAFHQCDCDRPHPRKDKLDRITNSCTLSMKLCVWHNVDICKLHIPHQCPLPLSGFNTFYMRVWVRGPTWGVCLWSWCTWNLTRHHTLTYI